MILHDKFLLAGQACQNVYRGNHGKVDFSGYISHEDFCGENTEGYIGYIRDDDGVSLVIAFAGSNDYHDWQYNLQFWRKTVPYNTSGKYTVSAGFLNCYLIVRDYILSLVSDIAGDVNRIYCIGHSLGGAIATLAARDIAWHDDAFWRTGVEVNCITEGSPRVGNAAFAREYNERIKHYRLEYGADMVCKVPPWLVGYRHVGRRIWLGSILHNAIFFPLLITIGNPIDHKPQRYYRAIKKLEYRI